MTDLMDRRMSRNVSSNNGFPAIDVDPSKMAEATDPSKVGTLKYPLLTHEKVDTRPTKNIKMKQYLCVKHALPKTRLTNAILYENVSQERHLELKMASISTRKGRISNAMDINKRAFMAQQDRKRRKWKREDEVRLAGMNLPSIPPVGIERRPSMDVMYHSCDNDKGRFGSASLNRKPVLPMMKIRKERTEIVFHRDKTFITKMPSFVQIDENIQTVFDAYRGKAFLAKDLPDKDERFTKLQRMLQPSIGDRDAPSRNHMVKMSTDSPTNSEPASNQFVEARVMIASRGQSRDAAKSAPSMEFAIETKSGNSMKKSDIIHSFKTQDLKELSKSLTRESHIDKSDLQAGQENPTGVEKRGSRGTVQTVPSLGLQYKMQHN